MRWLFIFLSVIELCSSLRAEERRIASFSPGATQCILDLGSSPELVAATRWCPLPANHPAKRLCDAFVPDLEALLQTKPTLVVLPRLANPLWAERCQQAGLRTVVLNPEGPDSVLEDIALLGEKLDKKSAAEKIVEQFKTIPTTSPKRLMIVWDGMVAGPRSYLAKPLEHFGFKMAGRNDAWKKIDLEEILVINPDAILWITSQDQDSPIIPWPEKIQEFSNLAGIKNLPCVQAGRLYQTTSGHRWLPGSGLLELEHDLGEIRRLPEQPPSSKATPR